MSKSIRIKDETYSRLKVLPPFEDEATTVDELIGQAVDYSDVYIITTTILACLGHMTRIDDPRKKELAFKKGMMAMMSKIYPTKLLDKAISLLEESWAITGNGYKITYETNGSSNVINFSFEPLNEQKSNS